MTLLPVARGVSQGHPERARPVPIAALLEENDEPQERRAVYRIDREDSVERVERLLPVSQRALSLGQAHESCQGKTRRVARHHDDRGLGLFEEHRIVDQVVAHLEELFLRLHVAGPRLVRGQGGQDCPLVVLRGAGDAGRQTEELKFCVLVAIACGRVDEKLAQRRRVGPPLVARVDGQHRAGRCLVGGIDLRRLFVGSKRAGGVVFGAELREVDQKLRPEPSWLRVERPHLEATSQAHVVALAFGVALQRLPGG